jgi:hypothetical protein
MTKKVYIERIEDPRGLVTQQRSVVRVVAEWVIQQETRADTLAFPTQCEEDGLKARVPKYLSRRQRTNHVCHENPTMH